jgi:hypothetical protein
VFYVSIGISVILFIFGFVFQFLKFRKYRKSKIFGYTDKNKLSFFRKINLSFGSKKNSLTNSLVDTKRDTKGKKSSLVLDKDLYVSDLDRKVLEDLFDKQNEDKFYSD